MARRWEGRKGRMEAVLLAFPALGERWKLRDPKWQPGKEQRRDAKKMIVILRKLLDDLDASL